MSGSAALEEVPSVPLFIGGGPLTTGEWLDVMDPVGEPAVRAGRGQRRAQEFSSWMLALHCGGVLGLHQFAPEADGFARRLHRAQVERLFTDAAFASWFAHQYAGVDPQGDS